MGEEEHSPRRFYWLLSGILWGYLSALAVATIAGGGMTWEYRVFKERKGKEWLFTIREFHPRVPTVSGPLRSANPEYPAGGSILGLQLNLEMMLLALDRPILAAAKLKRRRRK